VTVDFSQFGGGSAVTASNSAGIWTASYIITAGSIDATTRNVSVTATDNAGNTKNTADTTNVTVDNIAPTVSLSSIESSPTMATKIHMTVQFSEAVTGFDASDIIVSNGTKGSFAAVDGDTYTFQITPSAGGAVNADINAGAAQDDAGNGNTAAPQFSITYTPFPGPAVASPVMVKTFGASTSHNVDIPAVNAGDLLIVLFANDAFNYESVTPPANWQLLSTGTAANSNYVRLSVLYKMVTENAGVTSVDFTTSGSRAAVSQVYRITNWHGTSIPEFSYATNSPATASNTPDPPSLTPTWGSADTLWIAVASSYGEDATPGYPSYPTNYTDNQTYTSVYASASLGNCKLLSASRPYSGPTQDPGTFSTGAPAHNWAAYTLAVRPVDNITGIAITTPPTKTAYIAGQVFDKTGMVVTAYYNDNSSEAVTSYTFAPTVALATTDTKITVTYLSKTADQAITVAAQSTTAKVTIGVSPSNLRCNVDGYSYTGSRTYTWTIGSIHNISVSSTQSVSSGTRWVFDSWSDGGAQSHSYTVTSDPAQSVTATFTAQYQLTLAVSPRGTGNITGAESGNYYSGSITLNALPSSSAWAFSSWSGGATGDSNPLTLTMSAPTSITANFSRTTGKINTTTTLKLNNGYTAYGQPVIYTATVTATWPSSSAPDGQVQFMIDGNMAGTGSLSSGTATFTPTSSQLSVGFHQIKAIYLGNACYYGSISKSVSEVVIKAKTTTRVTAPIRAVRNTQVTITATVTAQSPSIATPTGTVTFKDGYTVLGTRSLVDGVASLNVSFSRTGTHTITVVFNDGSNFQGSSGTTTVIVTSS
jgi:hypothetical protein